MKKNVGLIRIENKESHSENDLATSPNAHSYKYLISPQNFTNRPNIEINEGEPMKVLKLVLQFIHCNLSHLKGAFLRNKKI